MGLMGRRVGCLRTASLTGNMRDQEVLRNVASELSAERRSGSDLPGSKSSMRHVLQRARRRSATPRPAAGFELMKQRIFKQEDQQRKDGEALRRLEQDLQRSRRCTDRDCVPSGDEGSGIDLCVDTRLYATGVDRPIG